MNWVIIERKWQDMAQRLQGVQQVTAKPAHKFPQRETVRPAEQTVGKDASDSSALA